MKPSVGSGPGMQAKLKGYRRMRCYGSSDPARNEVRILAVMHQSRQLFCW